MTEQLPSTAGIVAPDSPYELSPLGDVRVTLTVVIGNVRLSVKELLALQPGELLRLDRHEGDPIDIYVNDRLIARGKLVQLGEGLGVAMTEMISTPGDHLSQGNSSSSFSGVF